MAVAIAIVSDTGAAGALGVALVWGNLACCRQVSAGAVRIRSCAVGLGRRLLSHRNKTSFDRVVSWWIQELVARHPRIEERHSITVLPGKGCTVVLTLHLAERHGHWAGALRRPRGVVRIPDVEQSAGVGVRLHQRVQRRGRDAASAVAADNCDAVSEIIQIRADHLDGLACARRENPICANMRPGCHPQRADILTVVRVARARPFRNLLVHVSAFVVVQAIGLDGKGQCCPTVSQQHAHAPRLVRFEPSASGHRLAYGLALGGWQAQNVVRDRVIVVFTMAITSATTPSTHCLAGQTLGRRVKICIWDEESIISVVAVRPGDAPVT
mmetsp:Transcript_31125/g.74508  ORF Transcript_31125/g.74508 Transcript_31125/m.74508 type:complete len:327 (-) Transcript_31125:4746-5726(-)